MADDTTLNSQPSLIPSPELLAAFREPGFEPVSVTIADLVSLTMDARYQVVEVSLHRRDIEGGTEAGRGDAAGLLEVALREAFNEALRQVMERNAAHLSSLLAHGPVGKRHDTPS
jgi:DNA-binding protein YbaB